MRHAPPIATAFALAALLLLPAAAAAREENAVVDSSRFFPRWLRGSVHAGMSWIASPKAVGDRYSPGLVLGGALSVAPAPRLRVAVEAAYHDLPNGSNAYYGTWQSSGGGIGTTPLYNGARIGNGSATLFGAVAGLRLWRELRLEAGAGGGYFNSGYPKILFIDGATGEYFRVPGESGWGPSFTAGLAYEFKVRKQEKLLLSARWLRLDRSPEQLDFVPIRVGYRFD